MDRLAKSSGIVGLGLVFATNPLYHSFLQETVGFEYANHSIVTGMGVVYLIVGFLVVGLSLVEANRTFMGAMAIALVSLATLGVYLLTLGGPDFARWTPWLVSLALMLPLGAVTGTKRVGIVAVIGGALSVLPLRLALFGSSTGWNGPLMVLLWFLLGWVWVAVFGTHYISLVKQRSAGKTEMMRRDGFLPCSV